MKDEESLHKLTISISKEEHGAFKAYCAKKGVPLSRELRELMALRTSVGVTSGVDGGGMSEVQAEELLTKFLAKLTDFARSEIRRSSVEAVGAESDEDLEEYESTKANPKLTEYDLNMLESRGQGAPFLS